MYLTNLEGKLYVAVVGALAGNKADELLNNGAGLAHRIHDAAMHQVEELRTNQKAHHLRERRRKRS